MIFNEHVKFRKEKFGAVIFDTLREKVFVTNQTGKDVLTLLEEGNTAEDIIDSLACNYNEERPLVERDVKDFIDTLLKNDLVSDAGSY